MGLIHLHPVIMTQLPSSEYSISLRAAAPEDAEFLYQVYAHTRYQELEHAPWTPQQVDAFLRMQFQAQATHYQTYYPNTSYDLVLVNGEPAGRLSVSREPGHLIIMDIAILPSFRGLGIGTILLRQTLDEAAAHHQRATIHVEKENPARRLYERLGFTQIAEDGIYYEMEWKAKE